MLPDREYNDPGKEICYHIIRENRFNYWNYEMKESWFAKSVDLHIDKSCEHEMVTELNKISLPIIKERNRSHDLRLFSGRVFNECHELLSKKISRAD
jgi:hypothetical protein